MFYYKDKTHFFIYGVIFNLLQICYSMPANFTSDFEKKCSYTYSSNGKEIEMYVSNRTGIKIVQLKVDGPIVNGFFTLATEPDKSDAPHVLEHLIFMGSEDYPYKGTLDLLASKCLASGTGASTHPDYTVYDVATAGSAGFLNILPVYLDHILYPTLTDSAFTMEAYHITRSGEDAGVVYSENQGKSNDPFIVSNGAVLSGLYPAPSPYSDYTLDNISGIREFLTMQRVRAYHKKYYSPENLQLLVIGQLDTKELLAVVDKFEDKIVSKGARSPITRSWQKPSPPFEETLRKDILYPSNEETSGSVVIAFRGKERKNFEKRVAIDVFMTFFTSSSVSPLKKNVVDGEDLLTTDMYSITTDLLDDGYYVTFEGVALAKIDQVEPLLTRCLLEIHNQTEKDFPISGIRDHLTQKSSKENLMRESDPESAYRSSIIKFGIYENDCSDMDAYVDIERWYQVLLKKNQSYWRDLIKTIIVEAPKLILRVIPSIKEKNRIANETKSRIEKRKEYLGEEGLQLKQEQLDEAKRINELPIPASVLNDFPLASVNGVTFHPLESYSNIQTVNNHNVTFNSNSSYFDIANLSFKFILDDVNSKYVVVSAIMDTSRLDSSQRMYLPLLRKLIFNSDILRNGTDYVQSLDFMQELSRIFIERKSSISLEGSKEFGCGSFCSYLVMNMKLEQIHYEEGITLLYEVLYQSKFSISLVQEKVSQMLMNIKGLDEPGGDMGYLMNKVIFKHDSNQNQFSHIRQEEFLNELSENLKNEERAQGIISELNSIFVQLTDIHKFSFQMATDFKKLAETTDVNKPWEKFESRSTKSNLNQNIVSDSDSKKDLNQWCLLSSREHISKDLNIGSYNTNSTDELLMEEDVRKCNVTAFVKGSSLAESSEMRQSTNSIRDYQHQDMAALTTVVNFFNQLGGPIWNEIRGKGLAYSSGILHSPIQGILKFGFKRGSQPEAAYETMINVLTGYMNGSIQWNPILLETAKTSLLHNIISEKSSVSSAIEENLRSYFHGTYPKDILTLISKVTLSDVKRVYEEYFTPLLSPENSTLIVLCPTDKVENVKTTLERFGHRVLVVEE